MALYDAADLLARTRSELRHPTTSSFPADADLYDFLTRAQTAVQFKIAAIVPESQYGPPVLLSAQVPRTFNVTTASTTAISSVALFLLSDVGSSIVAAGIPAGATITGVNSPSSAVISIAATASATVSAVVTPSASYPYTYIFGTDADGNNITPIGAVEIYRTLQGIPGAECTPFTDYLNEGDHIRTPNYMPWAGPGPYARFITPALTISATVSPVLKPVQMRECLIYFAAARAWRTLQQPDNAALALQDAEDCFDRGLLALRTQFNAQEAVAGLNAGTNWTQGGFGFGSPLGG